MSKTDKTKPFTVQAQDNLIEVHDHSNGVCDLPTREKWMLTPFPRRYQRHACTWQPRNWHTDVTFSRNKSEGIYIAEQRSRKWKDHKDNYDY